MAVSGMPTDRFCFEGFLPRRAAARQAALAELADEPRTLVFFEATHRVAQTLADLAATLGGDRPAALCRELTKPYEQVRRATLAELAESVVTDPPRGEITLVVRGAPPSGPDPELLREKVEQQVAEGVSHRDAVAAVAAQYGVRKRDLYQLTLPE